jgi:hypothetical protein
MRNGRFDAVDGRKWEILLSTRCMYVVVSLTHPGFHLKIARAQGGSPRPFVPTDLNDP